MQETERDNISDYEQAVRRLVTFHEVAGRKASDSLQFAVEVVAEIYWVREAQVWRDMLKLSRRPG